jgi:hypothetical protein
MLTARASRTTRDALFHSHDKFQDFSYRVSLAQKDIYFVYLGCNIMLKIVLIGTHSLVQNTNAEHRLQPVLSTD